MMTIGRNDSCHCHSGKKYKKCCLVKDEAKARVARLAKEAEEQEAAAKKAADGDDETTEATPVTKEKRDQGSLFKGKSAFSAKVDRSMQTGSTPGWSRSSTGNR